MPTAIQLTRNQVTGYSSEDVADKGGGSNQFALPARQWIFGIYRNGDRSHRAAANLPYAQVFRVVGHFVCPVAPERIIR